MEGIVIVLRLITLTVYCIHFKNFYIVLIFIKIWNLIKKQWIIKYWDTFLQQNHIQQNCTHYSAIYCANLTKISFRLLLFTIKSVHLYSTLKHTKNTSSNTSYEINFTVVVHLRKEDLDPFCHFVCRYTRRSGIELLIYIVQNYGV